MPKFFLLLVLLGGYMSPKAQHIRGVVREADNLEPIIGATVSVCDKTIQTNEYGYFTLLKKEADTCTTLRVHYIGYEVLQVKIGSPDSVLTLLMNPVSLKEVEIVSPNTGEIAAPTQLVTTQQTVKQFPSIGGIPDLIRALAAQPGVSTGSELFSGLYVRGGNKDQNLILLDGAPIYGSSHLFSIVSLFNADALKRAELYKGIFPARYGGRLSSVLDVRFKEGRKDRLGGHWDLGILNSTALVEGPLGKRKKASFLLAGRTTYLNLLTIKERRAYKDPYTSSARFNNFNFFDLNGRVNFEPNNKNKFNINFYFGQDDQHIGEKTIELNQTKYTKTTNNFKQRLTNMSASAQWNTIISSKSSFYLNSSVNAYTNRTTEIEQIYSPADTLYRPYIFSENTILSGNSTINKFSGLNSSTRAEFLYIPIHAVHVRTGAEMILHRLRPGHVLLEQTTRDTIGATPAVQQKTRRNEEAQLMELAQYTELEIKAFNNRLLLNPGIRLSTIRPAAEWNVEPRLLAKYKVNPNLSLAFGMGKTVQYLHTLNGLENNYDKSIWVPSSDSFPPQTAKMVSLGVTFSKLLCFNRGFAIEGYQKRAQHQTLFNFQPETPFPYDQWTQKMLGRGTGVTQGIDLWGALQHGPFTASLGYSLSRSTKQFEQLNRGEAFLDRFDRRHELKISGSYLPKRSHWSFSFFWSYHSGMRYTVPVGYVPSNPLFGGFPAYNSINNLKMPAFHRLDLMAKYEGHTRIKWLPKYHCTFNLLNAYGRKNPYGLVLSAVDNAVPNTSLYQLKAISLFPVLPSVSFGISF